MNFQRYTLGYILMPIIGILLYSHNLMGDVIDIVNNSNFTIIARVVYREEGNSPITGACMFNCPDYVQVYTGNANKTFHFNSGSRTISNVEIWDQTRKKSFGRVDINGSTEYNVVFDGTKPSLKKK